MIECVGAEQHFDTCKEIEVESDNEQRYDHVPKLVETGHEGTVTTVWDQQMQTDTTLCDSKPNILIRDYEKGTGLVIDSDMSGDRNVVNKETEQILKYKDLTIEIQLMWNVKTKVMPVIIGRLEPSQNHSDST